MASREQTLTTMSLVALAFTSSTFAFLRIGSLPISLLEIALLVGMLLHLPLGGGFHARGSSPMFAFIVFLLFAATLPGLVVTWQFDGLQPGVMYNLIALIWIVLLFAYLQVGFDYEQGELDWLCKLVLVLCVLYFLVCIALEATLPTVLDGDGQVLNLDFALAVNEVDTVDSTRLSGLSDDPHLLGLQTLVALFFCLNFWREIGKGKSVFALAVILYVGFQTRSDTFAVGAITMILSVLLPRILFRDSIGKRMLWLLLAAVGCLLAFVLIARNADWVLALQEQAQLRPVLWENGFLALLKSPLFGWGLGSWSGMDGPLGLQEAESSLVDYLASAGIMGALVLFGGVLILGFATVQSGQPALLGGLVGILAFATLYNALREPLMWLVFFYIANNVLSPLSSPLSAPMGSPESRKGRRRRRR